jgi:mannose-6-phosphate isomerase-like protein (cupin superfamily)
MENLMNIPPFARLPLIFDVAPLLAEVAAFADARWVSHFNADYHDGGWQGAALRSVGGDAGRLYPDPNRKDALRDTELMARCPRIAAALRRFECPLRAVRILRLAAGSVIREHRDDDLRFEEGEARLHIPLATNPAVEFFVDGERVFIEAGECWYLNLSLPHRVQNRGIQERIHLVIDCQINAWLRLQIASGDRPDRVALELSGQEQFAAFREFVFVHPALQKKMRAVADVTAFLSATRVLGAEHGFVFGEEDVRAVMTRSRQAWHSQWVF